MKIDSIWIEIAIAIIIVFALNGAFGFVVQLITSIGAGIFLFRGLWKLL